MSLLLCGFYVNNGWKWGLIQFLLFPAIPWAIIQIFCLNFLLFNSTSKLTTEPIRREILLFINRLTQTQSRLWHWIESSSLLQKKLNLLRNHFESDSVKNFNQKSNKKSFYSSIWAINRNFLKIWCMNDQAHLPFRYYTPIFTSNTLKSDFQILFKRKEKSKEFFN